MAKQRIAEGASIGGMREQFDAAVKAARANEVLYFANYEDDYTTGSKDTDIRKSLETMRSKFLTDCGGDPGAECGPKIDLKRPVPEAIRKAVQRRSIINWEKQTDILPKYATAQTRPVSQHGYRAQ